MIVRFTNPDGEPLYINSDHVLEVHQNKALGLKLCCITTIDGSEFMVQGEVSAIVIKLNS